MFIEITQPGLVPRKELHGGKAAGLIWMHQNGVNVPPALVLPTTLCAEYKKSPIATMAKIKWALPKVKEYFVAQLGYMPLVSVRSGARVSMPGMMDTVLNVGLDGQTYEYWQEKLGVDCVGNCHDRLLDMYGSVVVGRPKGKFRSDELPDTEGQLLNSIEAVFNSWDADRAKFYRKMNSIPEDWGTAVVIQAMVFGNLNMNSGSGVLFTRNPDTGENGVLGEFLPGGQGEDVVAGVVKAPSLKELATTNPVLAKEILDLADKLETMKKDVQDVEFTVQDGKLYLLQTRDAKRSAKAAIKIAVDMVKEGLLTAEEARKRITARDLDLATLPTISPKFKTKEDYTGIGASSGVVTGKPVFSSIEAIASKVPCILITKETTPDDIAGMNSAKGVLTMQGGATSHAAVVARGMNKPCVVGLGLDTMSIFAETPLISICGATGRVWLVEVPVIDGSDSDSVTDFRQMVMSALGAVQITQTPSLASKEMMLDLGAEGTVESALGKVIKASGLCENLYIDFRRAGRPEPELAFDRMFGEKNLEKKMVDAVREWIVSTDPKALAKVKVLVSPGVKTKMKQIGMTSDIKSLILATGTAIIEGELDEATKWVVERKLADGMEFVLIGNYAQGTKSMISFEQGLQL